MKSKLHLIPQVVIDVAETLRETGNTNKRDMYLERLEAIKDYCDQIISKEKAPKTIHAAKRK